MKLPWTRNVKILHYSVILQWQAQYSRITHTI